MVHARIALIESYEDRSAIRDFFLSLVDASPPIRDLLRSQDPSRLVVVKPNWIQESHERLPDVWEPVITHPRVVSVVVETLADRMGGRGTICVCDAPHTHADFQEIVARGDLLPQLDRIRLRWPELAIEVLDLRRERWILEEGVVVERRLNGEDPRGYVRLNLGRDSLFHGHRGEGRYYGADYDAGVVNAHHRGEVHEYLIAGSPMACDLFVNLPKLKTHKKTGITCCLKNLVGVNGDKNWLPHHTESTPERGGDEFPSGSLSREIESRIKHAGRRLAHSAPGLGTWMYRKARRVGVRTLGDSDRVIRNGNWHGNDTCWRMALDLNRALLYGARDGSWQDGEIPARHYLAMVDGIVGGEGNGPLCPNPAPSRVLLGGTNPALLDAVAARLMGFQPEDLPIVREAFAPHRWRIAAPPWEDILVADSRRGAREIPYDEIEPALPRGFEPHFGWKTLRRSA
jgi:uncharacterized protein (DUF362 family)